MEAPGVRHTGTPMPGALAASTTTCSQVRPASLARPSGRRAWHGRRNKLARRREDNAPAPAVFTAIPNMPLLSAAGHTMVSYSGCRATNSSNPSCEPMSSASSTPPRGIEDAACSSSNSVFLAVCRLSCTKKSTRPTSFTRAGIRCLLAPST
jgi:hypothetical protein